MSSGMGCSEDDHSQLSATPFLSNKSELMSRTSRGTCNAFIPNPGGPGEALLAEVDGSGCLVWLAAAGIYKTISLAAILFIFFELLHS